MRKLRIPIIISKKTNLMKFQNRNFNYLAKKLLVSWTICSCLSLLMIRNQEANEEKTKETAKNERIKSSNFSSQIEISNASSEVNKERSELTSNSSFSRFDKKSSKLSHRNTSLMPHLKDRTSAFGGSIKPRESLFYNNQSATKVGHSELKKEMLSIDTTTKKKKFVERANQSQELYGSFHEIK